MCKVSCVAAVGLEVFFRLSLLAVDRVFTWIQSEFETPARWQKPGRHLLCEGSPWSRWQVMWEMASIGCRLLRTPGAENRPGRAAAARRSVLVAAKSEDRPAAGDEDDDED